MSDTFRTSLQMYRAGKSVAAIAAARGLAISTIEGHLARFIETGEIELDEVVPPKKAKVIRATLIEMDTNEAIGPVKAKLGDDYSYGEIRAVAADFLRQSKTKKQGA